MPCMTRSASASTAPRSAPTRSFAPSSRDAALLASPRRETKMLRLNRFDYIAPDSLSEALDLLTEPDSTVMAGGTDVLVNIKHRVATPRRLISIRRLPELIGMEDGAEGVTILAGTTLADVATDARIRSRYPALGTAAELISTPQVREVGTLGGNVCLDVRCNYYNQ